MRHGFWCHWKWVIWCFACFWGPRKSVKCCMGVCMHQNILFLEFGYFGLWRTHLPNYTFWGPLRSTVTLLSRTKKFIFQCQLQPKMTIKGRKKIEIKGTEIRKKVVISLCLFRYRTFFEYKTIAKKTCAPKTRATLAMPNIFFRVLTMLNIYVWF